MDRLSVLNPIALLFALLAVPIVLLYLLRLHRREQSVSSTLLWRQVVMDREANTLWQRLRPNILLVLQLLTLAFLVFALIRPYVNLPGGVAGKSVVLLDASASMQASDVSPSRFEVAKARVRDLVNGMGSNDEMALILVEGSPRTLVGMTSNKSELLSNLDAAKPSLDAANWSAAIALAKATTGGARLQDSATSFVVVSDGANADDLAFLSGNVRYIPIGASGNNLFISTLSLRRTLRGLATFVRVSNTGRESENALVTMRSERGLVNAQRVNVPPGGSAMWTLNGIEPTTQQLRVTLDEVERADRNALKQDDAAYAVYTSAGIRRALLVTRGNRFLEQALSNLPNLQVVRTTPDAQGALQSAIEALGQSPSNVNQDYDLYVLDGLTATLPANANVFVIGTQAIFSATGSFSNTNYMRTEPGPLAQGLNWRTVNVLEARRLLPPQWLKPVVESQGGPLLFAGDGSEAAEPGQNPDQLGRVVVVPFDLFKSDLPLQIAFPVLMSNAVEWLSPSEGVGVRSSVRPGEVVPLPQGSTVTTPDGQQVEVKARGFAQTSLPGVYQVQIGQTKSAFAVNFFNARESDITPNAELQFAPTATPNDGRPQFSQREIWNAMAVVALILLLIEWWIYQRGLPKRRAANQSPGGPKRSR